MQCVSCLTDRVVARDGDHWKIEGAALLHSSNAHVDFDLGRERQIRAAWLQGDNNDTYRVEISPDGRRFRKMWDAKPVSSPGLRPRSSVRLNARGRYIRLRPMGGDGNYSVTELQLFAEPPGALPAGVSLGRGISMSIQVRGNILAFGVALVGLLVLSYRKAPWWWLALVALVPLVTGYDLFTSLLRTWPEEQREVSLVRGVVAVVAAAALLREFWAPARYPAHRGIVLGVLSLCGVVGFFAFYNLGHPQFRDKQLGQPTYVHHLDLRQYYGTAKYFDEIGYRALYEADVAAFLEDNPGTSFDSIADRPMRSLRTHQMSTVGDQRARILEAPRLFSPERWQAYKADARYFRDAMGLRQYWSTFYDLGGNATPVWISIAHVMFNQFAANNHTFLITGLLDPLLILGAFVAIGFVFGPRTAFLCMVVFGANDFIMYGSNWGGATLRHDWMAYIAFGACALKRRKWWLGGALLALSTSIRAFPALSLIALAFPVLWWCYAYTREQRKLPTLRVLWQEQRPLFSVALGAAITLTVLFLFASALLGLSSWGDWYVKVSQLSADPHGNHISLRSLIAGWEGNQARVLADRLPLFLLGVFFYVGMVFVACRGQRFEQAAVLGMVLTPVLLYPANYYIHLVWLLPLVMVEHRVAQEPRGQPFEPRHVWVGVLLLGMCAAQYFTVLETDRGIHFYMASAILFATLTFMLTALVRSQVLSAAGVPLAHSGPTSDAGPAERSSSESEAPLRDSDPSGAQHAAQ